MMFIDASAIVAMMTEEEGAVALGSRLESAAERLTSPVAVFEAAAAIARLLGLPVADAANTVSQFIERQNITAVPVLPETGPLAIDAFARYGKGSGHPAQLNMSDCFAYACARHFGLTLLFKGNDFTHTDIEAA